MASWMVHLRVADALLDQIDNIEPEPFIVGNLAPDSGIPNDDWTTFTPSTSVSHFRPSGKKADPFSFSKKYFTYNQRTQYSKKQFSFYLGYFTHLMTDVLWSSMVVYPSIEKHPEKATKDKNAFIWELKKDWYDLDFKYLRDHPGFRAFRLYSSSKGFQNTFMDEFSSTAFDDRRAYISDFYLSGRSGLDREYNYLTEPEMDNFVQESVEKILLHLKAESYI